MHLARLGVSYLESCNGFDKLRSRVTYVTHVFRTSAWVYVQGRSTGSVGTVKHNSVSTSRKRHLQTSVTYRDSVLYCLRIWKGLGMQCNLYYLSYSPFTKSLSLVKFIQIREFAVNIKT